ncbi:MAG: DUF5658 family protein [Armatimonadota bacterium]
MQFRSRLPVLPVNLALVCIAMLDLITTLVWLGAGLVIEVNPIMAAVLNFGIWAFVGVKVFTLVAYVLVIEWYRRYRSARWALVVSRITLASYVAVYIISFLVVNTGLIFG